MARPKRTKTPLTEPVGMLEAVFSSAMDGLISQAEDEVDIITFAESKRYLNLPKAHDTGKGLHPQQAFILKC